MNPPIQAITFDAAGTLFDVAEPVGVTYSRIARNHGIETDQATLDRAFRSLWDQFASPFENLSSETASLDGHEIERRWWRTFVEKVFAKACRIERRISKERFDRLFDELFDHYAGAGAWRLRPDVLAVLEAIHGRMKIGVISNFDRRFHEIVEGLALEPFFDSITLSATVGASKPDSAIFAASARDLGVLPSEILHVGDDPARDWRGAEDAGFQVYQLDPSTNPLGEIPAWIASRS